MSQPPPSTILAGVAGEYLVAGELSRRGWIASLTLRNTRGVDILVTSESLDRSVGVQVKTSRGSKPEWILSKKAETIFDGSVFYAFVLLMDGGAPQYHIVPSSVVAEQTSRSHREWLGSLGRRGRPRKDTSMRKFSDSERSFLERWDLLGLDDSVDGSRMGETEASPV